MPKKIKTKQDRFLDIARPIVRKDKWFWFVYHTVWENYEALGEMFPKEIKEVMEIMNNDSTK